PNFDPAAAQCSGSPAFLGSDLYFGAYPKTEGYGPMTLWKTDGTRGGTVPIQAFSFADDVLVPFAARNLLLFAASNSTSISPEPQLWATAGTASTTSPLYSLGVTGSSIDSITAAGSRVVFLACGDHPGLWGAGESDAASVLETQCRYPGLTSFV